MTEWCCKPDYPGKSPACHDQCEKYREWKGRLKTEKEYTKNAIYRDKVNRGDYEKEFETNFKEAYEAGKLYLMAASSSTAEVTEEWIRQIKESFPGMDVMCDNLSLGLSCHIGPDGLGIACCNKAE